MKRRIFITVTIASVCYLLFSFCIWNFNVSEWGGVNRGMFCIISVFASVVTNVIDYMESK